MAAGPVRLYFDGARAGEQVTLRRVDQPGNERVVTFAVPADSTQAVEGDLDAGVYLVEHGGSLTGQRVTVAQAAPPKPLRLDESGAIVSFQSLNFPSKHLVGERDGVVLSTATNRNGTSLFRVQAGTSYCKAIDSAIPRALYSPWVVLESCAYPGHVLSHGGGAGSPVRLLLPKPTAGEDSCSPGLFWSSMTPGMSGDTTVSLIGADARLAGDPPIVARHAFSKLTTAQLAFHDELLSSDASWHLSSPRAKSSRPLPPCHMLGRDPRSAREVASKLLQPTSLVTFTIDIGSFSGQLTFHMNGRAAPKTVENFELLCRGGPPAGNRGYVGTQLQRVMPGFMAQGGAASGYGESAWGGRFDDETFALSHDAVGVLSMANAGEDTNGAQFFVIFRPQPHLDGKHVVFGRLVPDDEASKKTLRAIEAVGSHSGATSTAVVISQCSVASAT
jgi:peptidylprolyl isomerase